MGFSRISLLFSVAVVAGAANAIAGGGSFLSFPTLIVTGMPGITANATNTVALWPGILASTSAYRNALSRSLLKWLLPLMIATTLGSIFGAILLLKTPQVTFMKMVPWLLLSGTVLFIFGPRIAGWVNRRHSTQEPSRAIMLFAVLLQFCLGVYIGYYGAGVGFIILPILSILGMENIHAINGARVLLATCGNAIAIVMFIIAHAVIWPQALLMMIGAILGGYGGAHYAQKLSPSTVRYLVIAIGSAMTIYFFWKTRAL